MLHQNEEYFLNQCKSIMGLLSLIIVNLLNESESAFFNYCRFPLFFLHYLQVSMAVVLQHGVGRTPSQYVNIVFVSFNILVIQENNILTESRWAHGSFHTFY